jgi:SAM-dependent methyltransferase
MNLHLKDALKKPLFVLDFLKARRMMSGHEPRFSMLWADRHPCIDDRTTTTGFDRHYVYHLAWAARILAEARPELHIDISSSLYFSTLVSAFVPVKFFDYRPPRIELSNLSVEFADLCSLPFEDGVVQSLSCMHVVEHVGLGRYGDPLDPDGDLKAVAQLTRVLSPGGSLLFVVPVGRPRVAFNAHRIYSYDQVVTYFSELRLQEFSLIPDNPGERGLVRHATKDLADIQNYGCGCFWFKKGLRNDEASEVLQRQEM